MKLKKLEIHNIASIEDAVIDFEAKPLSDSNVILITGETGAGKSTILDAICLALYATTPRMNDSEMDGKWEENDTDTLDITDTMQLMRKNTLEAYTRLSFFGNDGNTYMAEWHVARKKKKLERTWSLNNETHPEASPQPGNGKGSGKDKEMAEAIQAAVGLTFDQFCRTTMLAQGEFTRFLKCSNKEKAAILEKITNTEQYAKIGAKVYDLTHNKYEDEKDAVDPKKMKQSLPKEERKALEENIQAIGPRLASLINQLETAQKKEIWLSTEKNLLDNQKKAQDALEQAQKALETDEFKATVKDVGDWDGTEDARNSMIAIQSAEKTIISANQTLQQLQPRYVTLLNGRAFIHQEVDNLTGQLEKINDEINAEGGQPVPLEELKKQKDDALTLMGDIGTTKVRVEAYFTKVKDREKEQTKLEEKKKDIEKTSQWLNNLKPKVDEAKTQYESLEKEYERLNLAINTLAEKLRANLQVNHKCPICGQAVKSLDTVPHEQQLQDIVAEAKAKRDTAKKLYDDLSDQQNKGVIWLKQNVPAYEKEKEAFDNDQSLQTAWKAAMDALAKCNITALDEHTTEAIEQAKGKVETKKSDLEKKIARAEKQDKLQHRLDDLKKVAGNVEPSLNKMSEDIPEWASLTSKNTEEIPNIIAEMQSLSTAVTTALTNKRTAMDDLQKNRERLNDFIGKNPEMTMQRLEQLLKLKDVIGQLRRSIDDKKNALSNAQGALKTVNGQIEEHRKNKPSITEDESIESLKATIIEIQGQQGSLNEQLGSMKQQLADDDALIAQLAEYQIEYEKKKAIFERWNKLDKLIGDAKGDKFRLIAQSYILANLVKAANVHMHTLTDRYTLHAVPGQELIILVEDAYQGGVKRPASTISGGESFLVSLALALALSEIGQSLKVETLFIDEGFGTLSGEPLYKAIETLESLHASNNRQVCAISHREEVKEKIPVQIQVIQNPQSSSSTIDIVPHIA